MYTHYTRVNLNDVYYEHSRITGHCIESSWCTVLNRRHAAAQRIVCVAKEEIVDGKLLLSTESAFYAD